MTSEITTLTPFEFTTQHHDTNALEADLMSDWIEVTDDPNTWPPIGVVILAKGSDPYHFVQLLCVEELSSDWPKNRTSWKVPHNIYEDKSDIIDYECSSTHTGNVTHWRPI